MGGIKQKTKKRASAPKILPYGGIFEDEPI
jgi:hypothetical protein